MIGSIHAKFEQATEKMRKLERDMPTVFSEYIGVINQAREEFGLTLEMQLTAPMAAALNEFGLDHAS